MLEVRDYSIVELRELLGTKDKQGIDRKLTGYGVEFTSSGWADNRIYTITAISTPFKLYAITKLGIPAQADFTKIQNLYFYFFCVDGFAEWPMVEMEAILEEDGKKISSKTISKWLKYLEHLDYVKFSQCEFTYYAIYKTTDGTQLYREISREKYLEGWRIYFDSRDEEGCESAYIKLRNHIGGHPYKRPSVDYNIAYTDEIAELIEVINASFMDEWPRHQI